GFKSGSPGTFVDAGDLGRLLVVDATDEYAPPGTLPFYLAGKTGLIVGGAKGRLTPMPAARAEDHGVATVLEAEVRPDRSIAGRLAVVRRGQPAEVARSAARENSKEREEDVRRTLRAAVPEAALGAYAVDAETAGGEFKETLAFEVPAPQPGRTAEPV